MHTLMYALNPRDQVVAEPRDSFVRDAMTARFETFGCGNICELSA